MAKYKEFTEEMLDLITQADAARLKNVTRSAITYLVKRGRLRTKMMFGHKLVYKSEVLNLQHGKPGPKKRAVEKSKKGIGKGKKR